VVAEVVAGDVTAFQTDAGVKRGYFSRVVPKERGRAAGQIVFEPDIGI
jgi:hypothetical protein